MTDKTWDSYFSFETPVCKDLVDSPRFCKHSSKHKCESYDYKIHSDLQRKEERNYNNHFISKAYILTPN